MAISQIDKQAALVLIDLQKGIAGMPGTPYSSETVIANAAQLVAAFRKRGQAIVFVNVEGGAHGRVERPFKAAAGRPADWSQLVPELGSREGDIRVTKHSWGVFDTTNLDEILKEREISQLVFGGIATSKGVESSARSAHGLGYNVAFAADAMTDRDPQLHYNSVTRVFPLIGEVGSTADLLGLLKHK
jgi:nicotinamidase-related amidase